MSARWYLVLSPPYDYVEPILEDGTGPTLETRDVAVIRAETASDAKWAACRLWERHGGLGSWPRTMRGEHRHPLSGVTAQRWADLDPPDEEPANDPDPRGWGPFYADTTGETR